ncbi:MAG: hypothetical protein ACPLKP_02170 [Microgenomates group bacterium]
MKKKLNNVLRILGVGNLTNQVFIFKFYPSKKKNFFQITSSKDGFDFKLFKKWGEIIKQNGQQEKIVNCQDFYLSKIKNSFFLTYKLKENKTNQLCGAIWSGFSHWQKTGKIDKIKESGVVVPSYTYQKHYLLYFGEKAINLAVSSDLIKWQILPKPIFSLTKKLLNKGFRLKIGGVVPEKKKLLLLYFLFQNGKNPKNYAIEGIIINKNNPFKLFKKLTSPLWKQKNEWKKETVFPVGILKVKNYFVAYWQNSKGILYAYPFYFSFPEKSYFQKRAFSFLEKFSQNPILKPKREHQWESKAVFNTAAVKIKNKIHFIYRAVGENDISVWGYAASKNGFEINEKSEKPIFTSCLLKRKSYFPFQLGLPFYLSGVGFGEGKYAIFHSLSPEILIDYFDDLNFDGKTFIRSYYDGKPKKAIWEERIRGVGPPPLKTPEGWLVFYHAMDKQNSNLYKIGAMILDLNQPTKILYRAPLPVLEPSEIYENEGLKPGIVYSCGAVIFRKKIFLYYGGADTVICVASAPLNIFLNQLKSNETPNLNLNFRTINLNDRN